MKDSIIYNENLLETAEILESDATASVYDYAFESALMNYSSDQSNSNQIILESAASNRKEANGNWWTKVVTTVKSFIKTLLGKLRGAVTHLQNAMARSSVETERARVDSNKHAFVDIDTETKKYILSGLSGVNFNSYVAKTAKKMIADKTTSVPKSDMFSSRPSPSNTTTTISVSELKKCLDKASKALNELNSSFPTTKSMMDKVGKESGDASYVRVAVTSCYNAASKAIREYSATVVEVSKGINEEREAAGVQRFAGRVETAKKAADLITDVADKGKLIYDHEKKIDWNKPSSILKGSFSIKDGMYYLDAKKIKNPKTFNKVIRVLSRNRARVKFVTKPSFYNSVQKTVLGSGITVVN